MDKKPGDRGDDLNEFRELIGSGPEIDGEDISLDSILAEYKYESVTKRRRRPQPEAPSEDTVRLMRVSEEMKKLAETAQGLRPAQDARDDSARPEKAIREERGPERAPGGFDELSEPRIEEAFFGLPEDFNKAFAPSETFVREEPEAEPGEEPKARKPRRNLLRALRLRARAKPEPEDILPGQALARLSSYVAALRLRVAAAFFLLLPLLYITLAQPYTWPLPEFLTYGAKPFVYLFVTSLLQLLIMLCGTDVIAKGFSDLFHLRPGMESLIGVSCAASLIHILSATALKGFVGFLPYSAVSACSVFFGIFGHYTMLSARRRTYKAAASAAEPDSVALEDRLWDDLSGFTRRRGGAEGFVARTEAPDMAQRVMSFVSPMLIIAALILALLIHLHLGTDRGNRFFWAWSALSASAAPLGMMLTVALPFSRLSKRLAQSGAALAGWSAAKSFSEGSFAVIGDDDLFPRDMVTLNGLKVLGRYSYEKVTSIAASLLAASGSGSYRALKSVSEGLGVQGVHAFEHYEGGGVGGEIGGDRVLLGSSAFILRMGIRLPKEMNIKNAVFVAVNMDIAGIFAINYIPAEDVEDALHLLQRQGITVVLAVRDFNITPLLLKKLFGIDSDQLEYPPIEDRLLLSDPERGTSAKPSAVLTRQGLASYAESIVGGMRLHRIAKINLAVNLIGLLGGLFLSFLLAYLGTSEMSLSPGNMILYMLIWCLPVSVFSMTASRY